MEMMLPYLEGQLGYTDSVVPALIKAITTTQDRDLSLRILSFLTQLALNSPRAVNLCRLNLISELSNWIVSYGLLFRPL
jgi:hypothetical protein